MTGTLRHVRTLRAGRLSNGRMLAGLMLAGLTLAGCVSAGPPPDIFDLRAAIAPAPTQPAKPLPVQVLVPMPSAIAVLSSDRVLVRPAAGQGIAYLAGSRWSDTLPSLLQARLIDALDAARVVKAVGRPGEGLAIDEQLLVDVRAFDYDAEGSVAGNTVPSVHIALYARLMNDRNGKVKASRLFEVTVPCTSDNRALVAAAFQKGLSGMLGDIVAWVAGAA